MSRKFILFGVILLSGFAVAMDDDDNNKMPKVDLTQLPGATPLRISPVRAASMPSPRLTDSSCQESPRSGKSSPRIQRFISTQLSGSAGSMERVGEGSFRMLARLRQIKTDVNTLALRVEQGNATPVSNNELNGIEKSLTELIAGFEQMWPHLQRVHSQPLRSSPSRTSFTLGSSTSKIATSVVSADEEDGGQDDQKSCPSDDDAPQATTE